jgi:hypothetical protein
MKPTEGQITSFGRHVVTFISGVLAFAALNQPAIEKFGESISLSITVLTTLVAAASGLWAAWAQSPFSHLKSVAANPEVAQIIVKDKALADALPAKVITETA